MKILLKAILCLIFLTILSLKYGCTEEGPTNPSIKPGSIYAESTPPGAEIFLQNTSTGKFTPDIIENLAPDAYDVKLKLNEFAEATMVANVKAGLKTTVSVNFTLNTGKLVVDTNPQNAEIYLNGINTNKTTPDSILNLDPNIYDVKLKFVNGWEVIDYVTITARQTTNLFIDYFGSLFISSNPSGAEVLLEGIPIGEYTPTIISDLIPGIHDVTLKLNNYRDTTFTVNVFSDQQTIVTVTLLPNISTTLYGPVRIYETSGTTSSQPAGLDLSSGVAHGVSSPEANLVDIYYSSAGFLVQSADLYGTLIRETDFLISSGTNLFDQVDSPLRNTGTWTTGIGDRENNYVFLYDHDGHYSKLKIVNWGGGNPGNPAWVEVQWFYNNSAGDNRF